MKILPDICVVVYDVTPFDESECPPPFLGKNDVAVR
jgi:hypothetical protein